MRKFNAIRFNKVNFRKNSTLYALKTLIFNLTLPSYACQKANEKQNVFFFESLIWILSRVQVLHIYSTVGRMWFQPQKRNRKKLASTLKKRKYEDVMHAWRKLIGRRGWMLEADWTAWLNAGSWLAGKDLPLTTVGTEERDVRGEEAALLLLQYSESVSSQLLIRLPFSIRKWSPNQNRNRRHLGNGTLSEEDMQKLSKYANVKHV